jgi:hypothetical protein
MTDPVTTALALQMEYGDDELKKDVDERIRTVVRQELLVLFGDPVFGERFLVNNAHMFNRQVLRAVKEQFNSPQPIY